MFSTFLFIKINIYTTASVQYLGKLLNKDPQFEKCHNFLQNILLKMCALATLNFKHLILSQLVQYLNDYMLSLLPMQEM